MVASGCGAWGSGPSPVCDISGVGAFVTPSVTREARVGSRLPRLAETPSGVLTATGLPGPGVAAFLDHVLPALLRRGVPVVVSVAGSTLGEYADVARALEQASGVAAVEVNLAPLAPDPVQARRAVAVVRRDTPNDVPVLAKLRPSTPALVDVCASVLDAGADAVVLPGAARGLVLDPGTLRPLLGDVVGDLCGPAVRPLGLLAVWEVRRALPEAWIVAGGGIRSGADALCCLAAGADAVQVGTALLAEPGAAARIVAELRAELAARGCRRTAEVVSAAHRDLDHREGA
jgi:dihydroorotate dehydrogenase (NAD+) catalytic subunit